MEQPGEKVSMDSKGLCAHPWKKANQSERGKVAVEQHIPWHHGKPSVGVKKYHLKHSLCTKREKRGYICCKRCTENLCANRTGWRKGTSAGKLTHFLIELPLCFIVHGKQITTDCLFPQRACSLNKQGRREKGKDCKREAMCVGLAPFLNHLYVKWQQ